MVERTTTVCPSAMTVIVVPGSFRTGSWGSASSTPTSLNAAPAPICRRTSSAQTVVSDSWFAFQHTPWSSRNIVLPADELAQRAAGNGQDPRMNGRLRSSGRCGQHAAQRTGRSSVVHPTPGRWPPITVVRDPDTVKEPPTTPQNGPHRRTAGASCRRT